LIYDGLAESTGTTPNLITRNCDAARCDAAAAAVAVHTIGTINVVERPLVRDYG